MTNGLSQNVGTDCESVYELAQLFEKPALFTSPPLEEGGLNTYLKITSRAYFSPHVAGTIMMVSHYPCVQFLAVMAMVGLMSFSSLGRVHAQSAGLPTTIYALNTSTTITGESHISILIIKVPLPSGSNSTVMVTSQSRFHADTGTQMGSLTGVGSATISANSINASVVDGVRYLSSNDNEENVRSNNGNMSFSAAQFNGNDGSTVRHE